MSVPRRRDEAARSSSFKTGEPVPHVRERRGEFHDMIRRAVGDAWKGGYGVIDARDGAPLPAPKGAARVRHHGLRGERARP